MPTIPRLTTKQAAAYLGVCKQRINAKIASGHYQGVTRCECGLTTMIPQSEINAEMRAKLMGHKR